MISILIKPVVFQFRSVAVNLVQCSFSRHADLYRTEEQRYHILLLVCVRIIRLLWSERINGIGISTRLSTQYEAKRS